MRILLIVPNIISITSFLSELITTMHDRGFDVHCACSLDALWHRAEQTLPATMHHIVFPRGMNPLAHARSAHNLNQLVDRLRPNLVHAHFSAAIFTAALAHTQHWPITIGTFQGVSFPLVHGWKAPVLRQAELWAIRQMDGVWVVTDDDQTVLRRAVSRVPVRRRAGYGFGCDLQRFDPGQIHATDRQHLRTALQLTPENFVFCLVGRFADFKGFGITVRAFLRLAPAFRQARLLLVGKTDALYATGLTPRETAAMQASPQIIDAGYQTCVEHYLALSDVMVFPSQREGMPVCLMEALAMGVPVITRDARGCRDVVRDQIDGFVLPTCNVEHLLASMRLLIENPPLRQRFAERALEGRERFNRLHYVAEQIAIYEDLVGGNPTLVDPRTAQMDEMPDRSNFETTIVG
jgi:glycosyltransferase involved in cell wall biosynthesis